MAPLDVPSQLLSTMATCTSVKVVWGAVREAGTCTYLVRAEVVETSANDGSGSENGGSGGAPAAPSVTTATQLEMTGLRAASAYIVRVAANCSDGRRSPWTDVAVSTEPPTLAPDAPNAPLTLQGGQDCRIVSLRLPASPAGCRQPDEYALQYLPDPAGQWLDHHQHLRAGSDVNVSGLRPGGTYEFRLSATNWIGVSPPGRSTGPIRSCAGTPSLARPEAGRDDADANGEEEVLFHNAMDDLHESTNSAATAMAAAVLVLICGIARCCCLQCRRRRETQRREQGARYERAAIDISNEQWTFDEDASSFEDGTATESTPAKDGGPSIRVVFQMPDGGSSYGDALQADVPTAGLTSVAAALQKLADVYNELCGQWPPPDGPLLVQYEDVYGGDLVYLHTASAVRDLLTAPRVVVSRRPPVALPGHLLAPQRGVTATNYTF